MKSEKNNLSISEILKNMNQVKEENENMQEYFSGNLEEWTQKMSNDIESLSKEKSPIIVNLAGPSCGGKGVGIDSLYKELEIRNLKCMKFSTDNYYKGISKMILEKVLPKYPEIDQKNYSDIIEKTKEIIKHSPFDEKFNRENISKIIKTLPVNFRLNQNNKTKLGHDIETEFSQIDFDTPNAINIDQIQEDLIKISKKEDFEQPKFSMDLSEQTGTKTTSSKEFDVILVEGIFALNPKLIENSDLLSFIESPNKAHLILRRFYRDVLGPNPRTSHSPEMSLLIQLKNVLPAAEKTIIPNKESIIKNPTLRKKFRHCLNPYTEIEEQKLCDYSVQDKIKISQQAQATILKKLLEHDYQIKETTKQKDHYLVDQKTIAQDPEGFPKYLLRIREFDNGKFELTYKGRRKKNSENKIIRTDKTIVKKEDFGTLYQKPKEVLEDFQKAGFNLVATIEKERLTATKDNVMLMIDQLPELGNFIEFSIRDQDSIHKINEIKKSLGLEKSKSYGPYFDQYISK